MKKKIMAAAVLSGLVLVAGAAQAKDHREAADFATLDLNGDGALSLEELQAQAEARFGAMDTNGDGAISAQELIAAAEGRAAERAAAMIERLDENGDGVLQADEMPRRGGGNGDGDRAARMFDRVDTDDDGAISEAEFEAAKEKRGARRDHGARGRG
jgi:Ca2+-binding EF-hand superfamily protein